jgi:hypothetical protein
VLERVTLIPVREIPGHGWLEQAFSWLQQSARPSGRAVVHIHSDGGDVSLHDALEALQPSDVTPL